MSKKNKTKKRTGKKEDRIKTVTAVLAIPVAILGIIASAFSVYRYLRDDFFNGSFKDPYLYYEMELPFDGIGYAKASASEEREKTPELIFSVRCFIDNPKNNEVFVENIYTDILSIEPVYEDDIEIKAVISQNNLRFYAINNGWIHSDSYRFSLFYSIPDYSIYGKPVFDGQYSLSSIGEPLFLISELSVEQGNYTMVAEYALNPDEFEKFGLDEIVFGYYLDDSCYYVNDDVQEAVLLYHKEQKRFEFDGQYGDSDDYSAQFFSVLDVDKAPDRIVYATRENVPLIQERSKFFIDTIVAPSKPCWVSFKNVIVIGGKEISSRVFTVFIDVPFYVGLQFLAKEISAIDDGTATDYEISKILQYFRYNPELWSIFTDPDYWPVAPE